MRSLERFVILVAMSELHLMISLWGVSVYMYVCRGLANRKVANKRDEAKNEIV